MFSHTFHSFCKSCIVQYLEKIFFKISFCIFFLSSVFILIFGFNQASWLDLMTLCTFSKTDLWFNVCFKFLMQITFLFNHESWLKFFSFFKFLSGKKNKSLWITCNFSEYRSSVSTNFLYRSLYHRFL